MVRRKPQRNKKELHQQKRTKSTPSVVSIAYPDHPSVLEGDSAAKMYIENWSDYETMMREKYWKGSNPASREVSSVETLACHSDGAAATDTCAERNAQPNQLSPDMQLGVEYTLLSQEELAKISSQPNWNEILAEKYPGSSGYLIFSRVGFNRTLDQAVIYVGQVTGPLMGSGSYYLLEMQTGEWKILKVIGIWIS